MDIAGYHMSRQRINQIIYIVVPQVCIECWYYLNDNFLASVICIIAGALVEIKNIKSI